MRISIEHTTKYHYDSNVLSSTQLLRLTPWNSACQEVLEWNIEMPGAASRAVDAYGNVQHTLALDMPHQDIEFLAHGSVDLHEEGADGSEDEGLLPPLVFTRSTALTQIDPALIKFADSFRASTISRAQLSALAIGIADHVVYTQWVTEVSTTAAGAFAGQQGVCQDHAHIFLACARHLGVPARYVSGYVYSGDQMHAASHAWAEAWVNGRWLTFDISNRVDRPDMHLKLAVGLDYMDACPVRGVRIGGGGERLTAEAVVDMTQPPGQ